MYGAIVAIDGGGHGQRRRRERRRTIGAEHLGEHPAGVVGHDHGDDEAGRERQRAGAEHLERRARCRLPKIAKQRSVNAHASANQKKINQTTSSEGGNWSEHVRLGGIEVGADVGEHGEDDQRPSATRPT